VQHLPESKVAVLRAVARRVVPETGAMDEHGWERFEAIVDTALGRRPPGIRRQFASFLAVVRLGPALRWGRTYDRLDDRRRDTWLRWLQDGPVGLFRTGFWGLKVLVFMGFYGQPEVWPEIGYAPLHDALGRLCAGA